MANTYNITIEQGADFNLSLQYKDSTGNAVNLTGYTARSQVRSSYSAPTALLTLTTENGCISIDGANGAITLAANAAQTAIIPASNGVYDIELVAGASVIRFLEGSVRITPEVTKV